MWVIGAIAACAAVVFAYLSGHEAGYDARALEDKNAMIDSALAQFRSEREATVYRQRELALLRVVDKGRS